MLMNSILSLFFSILSFLILSSYAGHYQSGWELTVDLKDPRQGSTSGNLVAGQSTYLSWDVYNGAPSQIDLVLSNDDPSKADSIPFYSNADVNWRSVTANLPVVQPGSNYFIQCNSRRGVWCGATNYFSVSAAPAAPPPPRPAPTTQSKSVPTTTSDSNTPTPSSTTEAAPNPTSSTPSQSNQSNQSKSESSGSNQTIVSGSTVAFSKQTTSIQVSVTVTLSPSSSAAPVTAPENSSGHKLPLGAIIGAAVGGAILLMVVIAVLVFILLRRRRRGPYEPGENGSLIPFAAQGAESQSEKAQLEQLVREREAALAKLDDRHSTNSAATDITTQTVINARIEELNRQIEELRQGNISLEDHLQPPPDYLSTIAPSNTR